MKYFTLREAHDEIRFKRSVFSSGAHARGKKHGNRKRTSSPCGTRRISDGDPHCTLLKLVRRAQLEERKNPLIARSATEVLVVALRSLWRGEPYVYAYPGVYLAQETRPNQKSQKNAD
ncbi:hypothetical protein NDU88_012827 [Pleurodeles waltl]|uniref:Uncharacterized protein n=1 Tax=Pleurodeles waltl TaxID=8319 RepID=A0AAV7R4Y8_PLEWA|nr:hypothetical protein NDU88_012827 [Pleurodeles waltl]